jgi:hypothetical protein
MSERGDRGKDTEKAVQKVLEAWNTRYAEFAYHRLPDARAAMGRLKAQPADFLFWEGDYGGFIEAKETQHSSRLARDKIAQMPILRKFAMAGAKCIVIIYHSEIGLWRIAKLEFFEGTPPSWDVSTLPTFESAEAAMNSLFNWR